MLHSRTPTENYKLTKKDQLKHCATTHTHTLNSDTTPHTFIQPFTCRYFKIFCHFRFGSIYTVVLRCVDFGGGVTFVLVHTEPQQQPHSHTSTPRHQQQKQAEMETRDPGWGRLQAPQGHQLEGREGSVGREEGEACGGRGRSSSSQTNEPSTLSDKASQTHL